MNTQQLAEKTGKEYGAVSRLLRQLTSGSEVKPNRGWDIPADIEARVVAIFEERDAGRRKIDQGLCITAEQQKAWLMTWKAALKDAGPTDWVGLCVVVAALGFSDIPGWLSKPWRWRKVGDRVLLYALKAGVDADIALNVPIHFGFTQWLMENGFVATE